MIRYINTEHVEVSEQKQVKNFSRFVFIRNLKFDMNFAVPSSDLSYLFDNLKHTVCMSSCFLRVYKVISCG